MNINFANNIFMLVVIVKQKDSKPAVLSDRRLSHM